MDAQAPAAGEQRSARANGYGVLGDTTVIQRRPPRFQAENRGSTPNRQYSRKVAARRFDLFPYRVTICRPKRSLRQGP
jgi:hypothetical protein